MKRKLAVILLAVVLLAADDPIATLRAFMKAALVNVTSFQLQVSSPAGGFTSVATVLTHPLQMHMQLASGAVTGEMYITGGYLYQNMLSSGWKRLKLPTPQAPGDIARLIEDATRMAIAPDVIEDGVTYGSFTAQTTTASIPGAPAVPPNTMTCTYDKTTYLVHDCKNALIVETFLKYNDPGNQITIPAGLSTAVDLGNLPGLGPASPAPSAAP